MKIEWAKLIKEAVILCFITFGIGIVFNTVYAEGYKLKGNKDNIIKIHTQLAYQKYNKNLMFFDARTKDDYIILHIKGAYSLPDAQYKETMPKYRDSITKAKEIVVYCIDEDCGLSSLLADKLAGEFKNKTIYLVTEGLNGWLKNKYPTQTGEK